MEVFNKVCCTVFLMLLFWNVGKLLGSVNSSTILNSNRQSGILQKEVHGLLLKSTPWDYQITTFPWPQTDCLDDNVDMAIFIQGKRFTSFDKALKFSLPIYEDFIRKINRVRILRPFLWEFPATPKSCILGIRFIQSPKENSNEKYIECLVFKRGIDIRYRSSEQKILIQHQKGDVYLPLEQVPDLIPLCDKGISRCPVDKKPVIEPCTKLLFCSKENPANKFFEFIKEWVSHFPLKLIVMGETDRPKIGPSDFSFSLFSTQKLLLKEVQTIAATCAKDSLNFIKSNPNCQKYFERERLEHNSDAQPSPEYIAFRIGFWDENIDRVVQPYIAEVRFVDCVFKYYTADEEQRLVLVHQETFDEAMQFLNKEKSSSRTDTIE